MTSLTHPPKTTGLGVVVAAANCGGPWFCARHCAWCHLVTFKPPNITGHVHSLSCSDRVTKDQIKGEWSTQECSQQMPPPKGPRGHMTHGVQTGSGTRWGYFCCTHCAAGPQEPVVTWAGSGSGMERAVFWVKFKPLL